MYKLLFLFGCFAFSLFSRAQEAAVTGKVSVAILNEQSSALENVTVELLRSQDSALIKTALTDKNGIAELEGIKPGRYLLKATMVGYNDAYSAAFSTTAQQPGATIPLLTMFQNANNQLQGVTVTGKKPFIQKLTDRIVVNVDNSIVSAGSSALDVLERSPGITLDGNDAISLRGRAGVIIMIDGKPSPMTGADLATYLRGLPSNAIESIHIITNPSAKYDAAGNSGIIDIRMKKDQRLGTNGTLTASYGQGVYPKTGAGATLNHRNKKLNLFASYNYSYRKNLNHLFINRNFFDNGVFRGSDDKDNLARIPVNSHAVRLGADFFLSKKTILGVVTSGNFFNITRNAEITSNVNGADYKPAFSFQTLGTGEESRQNSFTNLNIKHSFNDKGKELTADIDYGTFSTQSLSRTASSFYDLNGAKKADDEILDGDQDGDLTLKTGKIDFTTPVTNGGKFEAGYKFSFVSSDNDAKFFTVLPGGSVVDEFKTNRFFYKEYNNAAYANFSREFKKFNVQVGLRGEQTVLKTRQVKGNVPFKKDYFELFPSAFFNYKLKEDKTIGLSVSRRIDRPGYFQLNPFLFQIDASIYSTGDPHLKPQMTWSYEGSYTVKNMSVTLGYSHTKDPQDMVLSPILDVLPDFYIEPGKDSNITVQIPVNLQSSDYVGLTTTLPIRIKKWWNMVNNLNVYYNYVKANLAGVAISNGAPAATLRTNNTFTFNKGWSAEMNANVRTGGRYGYSKSKPQWGVDLGTQKAVLKGKGTVRFNVTDVFWTNLPKSTIIYEGKYIENWHAYRDSRVATLSFSYRFGSNKIQAARKRTSASEEEIRRAGGN